MIFCYKFEICCTQGAGFAEVFIFDRLSCCSGRYDCWFNISMMLDLSLLYLIQRGFLISLLTWQLGCRREHESELLVVDDVVVNDF